MSIKTALHNLFLHLATAGRADANTLWRKTANDSQSFSNWKRVVLDKLVEEGFIEMHPDDEKSAVYGLTLSGKQHAEQKHKIDVKGATNQFAVAGSRVISKMAGHYVPTFPAAIRSF